MLNLLSIAPDISTVTGLDKLGPAGISVGATIGAFILVWKTVVVPAMKRSDELKKSDLEIAKYNAQAASSHATAAMANERLAASLRDSLGDLRSLVGSLHPIARRDLLEGPRKED